MPGTSAAQWAMHAAINKVNTDLSSGVNHAEDIKKLAEKRAEALFNGATPSPESASLDRVFAVIGVAAAGIGLAYLAVSSQLGEVKNLRLAFIKERETGTATFVLPTNKETTDLSNEERFIKSFVSLTTSESLFATYSGVHSAVVGDDASQFHSILPFYSMGDKLGQTYDERGSIGKQRRAIGLFLKASIPALLSDIDNNFQTEYRFVSFWKSVFQGENYLNDLRAARFMVMGLANILWNLQHPVDPQTGFPLTLIECDKLCAEIELYLYKILDSAAHDRPPYLKHILHGNNRLLGFVRQVSTYTQAMRAAYMETQLHEVNIDDVTSSAHQALEIINSPYAQLLAS